ncbi:hypothetical protein [Raoultibacter phocaeensis]|uniref:hypothetical protein n=1 Tax=Raoultibacter phocaeensis TaxID=2479841 RepID=UPI001117C1A0|nr:hypothetical protein [Raoultibacter phocaeensis]
MKQQRMRISASAASPRRALQCGSKLIDTSGSSIILALVFFLICAIVGSIVLTAASVNSKATSTYQEAQQAEYTVTSAADLLGSMLAGTKATWAYDGEGKPIFSESGSYQDAFGTIAGIWQEYGNDIWDMRTTQSAQVKPYTVPETLTVSADSLDEVHATIEFDRDLNITVTLSLDPDAEAASGYSMLVSLQAIPEFDRTGKLLAVSWDSYTVAKASSATEQNPPTGGDAV